MKYGQLIFFKKNWQDDFIDFESTIKKVQQKDRTFINFDEISIFDEDNIYNILRSKQFFLGMDSIENMISCMSPARLMIKIWEFSHHFLYSTADKCFDCQCEKYLNI